MVSVNSMYPLKGMTPRVGMLGRKGIVGSSNSYPYCPPLSDPSVTGTFFV
jgi:hypothetical protein